MAVAPNIRTFPVQVSPSLLARPSIAFGRTCPPLGGENKPILFDSFFSARGTQLHKAIDIAAVEGSAIVSPVKGRVLRNWTFKGKTLPGAGRSERGGWFVRLRDEDGFIHYFAHMQSRPLVSSGSFVRPGQIIGYVGRTGAASTTCPHLHYSITNKFGAKVNPFPLLKPLWLAGSWRLKKLSPRESIAIAALLGAPFVLLFLRKRFG